MTGAVDVRRLIRIATVLFCVIAAFLVYFTFNPDVDAAALRVDQAELQLNSDRNTSFNLRALADARNTLSNRYAKLFAQNPEAVFIRGLAADVTRHGVTLVSTTDTKAETAPNGSVQPASASAQGDAAAAPAGDRTVINVSLRGSYRSLLATIGELSLGPEIVRVDAPTLSRDKGTVDALVPVTIFEPNVRGQQSAGAP